MLCKREKVGSQGIKKELGIAKSPIELTLAFFRIIFRHSFSPNAEQDSIAYAKGKKIFLDRYE